MVSLFDVAERKRFGTLFSALRYGIKARTKSIENNKLAYDFLYDSLEAKAFAVFKNMLLRRRKIKQRVVRLRKIHYRNLVVKSFSALLFNF